MKRFVLGTLTEAIKWYVTFSITYFVAVREIEAAYLERGYKAYGGEWLLIGFVFIGCYMLLTRFFDEIGGSDAKK